jgi:gluconokinase
LNTEQKFAHCVDQMQILVDQDFTADSEASNGGEDRRSLVVAPFFSGERSTGFRDGATGAVLGLTRETTPAHFFKSCLEGVSMRLKAIVDLILQSHNENDADARPILVASGKALEKNDLWRQMIADCSGLSIVLDKEAEEGTSRGVAQLVAMDLLGRETFGAEPAQSSGSLPQSLEPMEEQIHPFKTSHPRPHAAAYFRRKATLQEEFINSITPLYR